MKKKVLVIDDEELILKSVVKLLQKSGFEVTVCACGEDAVRVIEREPFDVIVSDVRMPSLNGVAMIKVIRERLAQLKKKKIPEILMTGYADDSVMQEAEKLGVTEFFYKPFDVRVFLDSIKKAAGG